MQSNPLLSGNARVVHCKRSVMILLGLGGTEYSTSHATNSAELCSQAVPEHLSVLTTSFPRGKNRVEQGYKDNIAPVTEFGELSARESLEKLKLFLESLDIRRDAKTIFRSDHALTTSSSRGG